MAQPFKERIDRGLIGAMGEHLQRSWAAFPKRRFSKQARDGLELLVFQMLRDLGFDEREVFRAIVVRRSDAQHNMVTLWFEEPRDPWVIDPTGAMTSGMPRLSQVEGWMPLKVFSELEEFTPRRVAEPAQHLAAR